jgi:hypothetical protein
MEREVPDEARAMIARRALAALAALAATVALLGACSLACAPAIRPTSPAFAPDPDTEPLPSAPRPRMADPRAPAPAEPSTAKPEPVGDVKPEVKPDPPTAASAAPKPAPKPAGPPAAAADCGAKDNPCPMQKVMRGLASASTPEALEAAFTRVAALSPNAGWQWTAIAKKGAELAKSGDTATAKKQCKACHDQHRDAYKSQYRARKL